MIPISLTFKGLYSYRESQTINFEKLTSSQLFGIFGPIGCGKSSILEAIMFALYDQSDRLKTSGDNRYYNMLNLQSDELEIDFIFRSDAAKKTKHRVYFRASRNRNHYEQVSVRSRDLYVWEDGTWIPLEDKDASQILGMTYQNFMQTVIIPQGKFRDFVDQNATQRTKMLRELFRLEKFELGQKTGTLLKKSQLAIKDTEGRLAEIGQVSEEEIEQARKEGEEWEKALTENRQRQQEAEKACQQQEELRKLFENIRNTETELRKEEEQQGHYQKKEQRLHDYQRAVTYFNEILKSLVETKTESRVLRKAYQQRQKEIARQESELAALKKNLAEKNEVYQQREVKEQQCQDLEHIIEIRKYKAALEQQEQQLAQARKQFEETKTLREELRQQLSGREEKLTLLDEKLKRQAELQQLLHWHENLDKLQQESQEVQQQQQQYGIRLKQVVQKKIHLLQPYEWARNNGSFEKSKVLLKTQMEACRASQEKLNALLQELQISEKLASYADALSQGSACPLCGSTHHPQVAHHASVSQQLKEQMQALEKCRQEEKELVQLSEKIAALEIDFNSHQQLEKQLAERQQQLYAKIKDHQQQFCWEDFKNYEAPQIRGFLQKLEAMGEEAQAIRQQLQKDRAQQQALEESLNKALDAQHAAQQKEIQLSTSISNHLKLLKTLPYEKLEAYDMSALQHSLEKGRLQLKTAVAEYEQAQQACHAKENELSAIRSRAEAEAESLQTLEKKADHLEKEVTQLCQQKNFSDLNEVQQILSQELDVEAEQEAINLYKTRLSSCRDRLQKLREEAEGKFYQEAEHRALLETLQAIQKAVQECQENCALSRQHVKSLLDKLRSSRDLQQKLQQQQKREENLKELRKLFIGSGFVKYVSSVYLDNLCRTANVRFMKLTRNNLSLELNEEGEFIVRDYLNNGKTRLLKTLSGGQTFQAALCLALALAENVKTLNQAEQSFFFLDEGFGSLDRESLRVVFDALKSLRQEKRIVGIISHVEELQQEIDVFLRIENDKERGSLVSCSWE
ncbi:MAG: SbcC/MukB-like Walker B domain-containing protein [Cyclobacteriaceae bacterium]